MPPTAPHQGPIDRLTREETEGFIVLAAQSAKTAHELYKLKANLVTFFAAVERGGSAYVRCPDGADRSILDFARSLGLTP
jgi:hypothetical protein